MSLGLDEPVVRSDGDTAGGGVGEPSPEALAAVVERAQEVIAGRVPARPMATHPEVGRILARELKEKGEYYTEAALRRTTDSLNLQAHYGGRPVACFTAADGTLDVLAWGEAEIEALFLGLTAEERDRVDIRHPPPFIADFPGQF